MTTIKLEDDTSGKKKAFTRIALFEKAYVEQDDNGLLQVTLTCTSSAMKYIFNIEHLGYLRYKLRCITNISSRYTYILFLCLEQNRYRKAWEMDLQELKEMLCCEKIDTYRQFKEFNKQVLKRAQKELHEKTECRFAYTPIKKGRSVVAIHFEVETLPKDQDDVQLQPNTERSGAADPELELWQEPLEALELSPEQYAEIFSVLTMIPENKLPSKEACFDSIDLQRYHYLDQKIKTMMVHDSRKTIRSKYSYLLKMLKKDAGVS